MLPTPKKLLVAGLLSCLAAFGAPASAAPVIYSNGGPNQVDGNNMSFAYQAEDFVLAGSFTVTDVHFWSLEASNAYRNGFYWGLYGDAGGSPGAAIARGFQSVVTRTVTGAVAFGDTEFLNEFDVTATVLAAGTYWLVLHNGASNNFTDDGRDFLWESTALAIGASGHELLDGIPPWSPNGVEHAFELTGSPVGNIPEPTSVALMAAGLAGLMVTRLRARRRG